METQKEIGWGEGCICLDWYIHMSIRESRFLGVGGADLQCWRPMEDEEEEDDLSALALRGTPPSMGRYQC